MRWFRVTTCVVVWIEIIMELISNEALLVTTCVVVWIEIYICFFSFHSTEVTTCVVVWIEIFFDAAMFTSINCHHLRGGVD